MYSHKNYEKDMLHSQTQNATGTWLIASQCYPKIVSHQGWPVVPTISLIIICHYTCRILLNA